MNNQPLAKKSLGQHWLNDPTSLEAMLAAVDVVNTDTILEIGPGLGSLTRYLTAAAKQVIAVEFDPFLANGLAARAPAANLQVVQANILEFDFRTAPAPYKIVANIPYYLTSNLIRVISETANPPDKAAILIQKEVAERVCAQPGAMSLLSVTAQFYWEASLGPVVAAHLFTPPPKVDSQILILNRRESLFDDTFDPKAFFRLVKAGFSERRKTLVNSLSGGLRLPKSEVGELLAAAAIDPKLRPQNLSLGEWRQLYAVYTEYGKI